MEADRNCVCMCVGGVVVMWGGAVDKSYNLV